MVMRGLRRRGGLHSSSQTQECYQCSCSYFGQEHSPIGCSLAEPEDLVEEGKEVAASSP